MKRLIIIIAVIIVGLLVLLSYPEPRRNGLNKAQWLQLFRENTNYLGDPLKIVNITEDSGADLISVETHLSYVCLTNNGFFEGNNRVQLKINGKTTGYTPFFPSTNGNCVLSLDGKNFMPGTNTIQIEFMMQSPSNIDFRLRAFGPVAEFISSNICYINPYIMSHFTNAIILYASLKADNADYRIELCDTNGAHVKNISGTTTNGIINEKWNLTDDSGKPYLYPTINATYHVTIFGSLSQTISHEYKITSP